MLNYNQKYFTFNEHHTHKDKISSLKMIQKLWACIIIERHSKRSL